MLYRLWLYICLESLKICSVVELHWRGKIPLREIKEEIRRYKLRLPGTHLGRVSQSQEVAQNAPLLPYFLGHKEILGSEKSLCDPPFVGCWQWSIKHTI